MREPFIGSEALAAGTLTRYRLRSRFVALHPDVYVDPATELTATRRACAAWLWSRRRGIVAGRSASALHGAKWVDHRAPAQLVYQHRRPPAGINTWSDSLSEDEIQTIAGLRVTTPRGRLSTSPAAIPSIGRSQPSTRSRAQPISR